MDGPPAERETSSAVEPLTGQIGPRCLVGAAGPGRVASPALATLGHNARFGRHTRVDAGPHGPVGEDGSRLAQTKPSAFARCCGVWRASSLVECVNSVARMQQARHRKMTQGLLDLKRLYWNLRRFRTGRRKDQTPYGLLGLKLPDLSFWEFLKLTPEELREQLSALEDTP